MELEECLLREVFGLADVAKHAQAEGVNATFVLCVQFCKCGVIASLCTGQRLLGRRWIRRQLRRSGIGFGEAGLNGACMRLSRRQRNSGFCARQWLEILMLTSYDEHQSFQGCWMTAANFVCTY